MPSRARGFASSRLVGLVLLAASSGLMVTALAGRAAEMDEPPLQHVVLIVSDTMAARHLGLYGYAASHTAALDTLATKGVLFRHCLVPMGWTLGSHMSLFTGLDPGVHRVGKYRALPEGIPLLAELLKQHGFRTAGFPTANEWLAARYGFDRGFDHYQMLRLETDAIPVVRDWLARYVQLRSPHGQAFPFFLFYHAMDCHSRPHTYPYPYLPVQREARGLCRQFRNPPAGRFLPTERDELFGEIRNWDLAAYDRDGLRCGYDACISAWDEFRLRRMLMALEQTGHLRDTLVIITADHGEELGQHGGWYHDSPYGEVREVPLLMLWPGHLPAGAVVERHVSLLDITPTVLDLAGLAPPEPCQGLSLRPLLVDPAAPFPDRDFLVDGLRRGWMLLPAALVAPARGGWWSLVAQMDTTGTSGTFRPPRVEQVLGLYDLVKDPGETLDLSAAEPELMKELKDRLEARFTEEARLAADLAGAEAPPVELSDEQKRRLRSLGY